MWYLVLALFLCVDRSTPHADRRSIAIIEKDNIQDPATDSWFNLFTSVLRRSLRC